MEQLLIGLISGAVGGNAAGKVLPSINQGTVINSIAGIIGGGVGGSLLSALGAPDLAGAAGAAAGLDLGSIIQQVAGGGVGGGLVLAVVGFVRNKMAR